MSLMGHTKDMSANPQQDMVTLIIDGKQIVVPKGTNLIEAAKHAHVDVPHYCYHPHLSIAGNCRMCQVQIKGRPKLEIACNTVVAEGMEVATHLTSKEVEDAQAATLEFILINHPLDCTVCDQAGHCKLQDYHYEYNARSSRFLEEKEHKVKAEPLGPTVILDGERCIMCTRCVRFCDEITGTSELGMLNRGDRSVIAVNKDRVLDNPLSGTVVDLCPVGALTHLEWRFNTRIWFTRQTDSICTGCSTGCNVNVAERDGEIVQVKARLNPSVNKEWLCDEGRYGFMRFLPPERVSGAFLKGSPTTLEIALNGCKDLASGETVIFASTDLTTEDYSVLKKLLDTKLKGATVVVSYKGRTLTPVEAILVSPDYAANFKGAEFSGIVSGNLERNYAHALSSLTAGKFKNILILGDRGILAADATDEVKQAISQASLSVAVLCDMSHPIRELCHVVLPGRSILEKSGLLINRAGRIQYAEKVVPPPEPTFPEWRILTGIASVLGVKITDALGDREATLWLLKQDSRLSHLTIREIKSGGFLLGISKSASSAIGEAQV